MVEYQADAVDKVIKNAIEVMESSKYQIFEICEGARSEQGSLNKELKDVIDEIRTTIDKVDKLELQYRGARIRLTEVSKDFQRFKENDIRLAYEKATDLQMDLSIYREKESNLRARRDDLQKRIRNVEKTIERAEALGSQINVVSEYLAGDLNNVTRIIESAKNRQLLGLKIILAQEEERKRIAREIHDGVAQSMANMVIRAEITERMLGKQEYEAAKDEVIDLKGQIRMGLEEIRKIIFNLRPMALDDLGLIPTLRKYVQDFEEKTKIRTTYDITNKEKRLPSAMEVAIYRLVQEAFTNALKHANASFLSLGIVFQEQMVKITVQDNGVGFLVGTSESLLADGTGHFGLIGMRERVELLEGNFEVVSEKGKGTVITMTIPIPVS